MPALPSYLSWEIVYVQSDEIEPSRLIWRRYKRPAPGMLEIFLAANPHIMPHLGRSPYLPQFAVVRLPIDRDILTGRPRPLKQTRLYGEA